MDSPAGRHQRYAAEFSERVLGVGPGGWDASTPVPEWRARDVVGHLIGWVRSFLAGSDVELAPVPSVADDPVGAWESHRAAIQVLLDDPVTTTRSFTNPHIGELPLDEAIDRFYTTDVFLHTWDLARATGQADTLDPEVCEALLAGMIPIEDSMRRSGQYGPKVDVPETAPVQDRLLAFIGRDPAWHPS